jgi:hypothetical protein
MPYLAVLAQRLSTSGNDSKQCLQKLRVSPTTILAQDGQCVGSIRLQKVKPTYKTAGAASTETKNNESIRKRFPPAACATGGPVDS